MDDEQLSKALAVEVKAARLVQIDGRRLTEQEKLLVERAAGMLAHALTPTFRVYVHGGPEDGTIIPILPGQNFKARPRHEEPGGVYVMRPPAALFDFDVHYDWHPKEG